MAVLAMAPGATSPEQHAAEEACGILIDLEVAEFGCGYLEVHDLDALASIANLEPNHLASHPAGLVLEDGSLVVPWPLALEVIQRLVRLRPEPVISRVEQEDAQVAAEAIQGRSYRIAGHRGERLRIAPEQCTEFDERFAWGAPKRSILRSWCGTGGN